MSVNINNNYLRQAVVIFTGIPMLIWVLGNFPERSLLKESISIITILVFCQMIGLFFLSRANKYAVKIMKMSQLLKFHKIIGYTCVSIMLLHPVFIVVPRFFESGVAPVDAFITIITTLNQGVMLGMTAWCLMLILGITAFARNKLPMEYKTWRVFHGIVAILFISVAAWHVIDLGRHSSLAMSIFITLLAASGVLLSGKQYLLKIFKK